MSQCNTIFQYVFSNVFPEIYCATERRGFELKRPSTLYLKLSKTRKNWKLLGKIKKNYEDILNETCVYEQKPIKIDKFNKAKEKEVKERIEKRKIKRRKVAEQNKL